jgi:hypothetical protein
MKNIDIKSLIIGALLTSTIFLGVAATSTTDKWDDDQVWDVVIARQGSTADVTRALRGGWEPIAVQGANIIYRSRIK